ncbi:hypothetical protein ES703_27607 [subsurface metagenome]
MSEEVSLEKIERKEVVGKRRKVVDDFCEDAVARRVAKQDGTDPDATARVSVPEPGRMIIVGQTKVVDDICAKLQPKLEEGFKVELVALDNVGVREVNALREELIEAYKAEGIEIPDILKVELKEDEKAEPFKLVAAEQKSEKEEVKNDALESATATGTEGARSESDVHGND